MGVIDVLFGWTLICEKIYFLQFSLCTQIGLDVIHLQTYIVAIQGNGMLMVMMMVGVIGSSLYGVSTGIWDLSVSNWRGGGAV